MKSGCRKIMLLMLVSVVSGLTGSGCAYLRDRGNDAMDMIDLGLTFSREPGFAFYYDFVPVIPIGIGAVNGRFAGLGGGKFALGTPHYQRSTGVILWGQEEVTFDYSRQELEAMPEDVRQEVTNYQRSGLIGLIQGPVPDTDYLISCPHYLHLGWVGVVATPRYLQMLDFLLGWTTLDIGGDDRRWQDIISLEDTIGLDD